MKLLRTITPEIRIVSARDFTCDYIASDETLDCYHEVIRAAGWRFTQFAKNAPFVDSHNYGCIDRLLGAVIDFRVSGAQLIERVKWAADVAAQPLAALGWELTEKGYLKAVSVGFRPVKMFSRFDGAQALNQAAGELKLDAETAAKVQAIYWEQEQLELSACILGANPGALAKAHSDGAVSDARLASVGFDDSDVQFLHDAAEVFDEAAPAHRLLLARSIGNIPFRKSKPQPATEAIGRAAASEAQQHERTALMRKMRRLTTSQ